MERIQPSDPMMLKTPTTQPDDLLRWMANLADPSRLRLLRLVERHELGVSDLCDVVQMPQSTVSRHLKLLADEGWVTAHRRGTTNLYRMLLDELAPAQRELWLLTRRQSEHWATWHQDQVRLTRRLNGRRDSRAFFADAAERWDKTRREMYGELFQRDAALALLPGDWVVADLGCGTGTLTAEVAQNVAKVIAVDNSDAMLAAAEERMSEQTNVDLRHGELESLPIDDDACDAALCVLVLTYVEDPSLVAAEIRRVVRPGGIAVVLDLMRHDREDFRREMGQQSLGFEPSELSALLLDAGFERATCRALDPVEGAKGPALLLARGEC